MNLEFTPYKQTNIPCNKNIIKPEKEHMKTLTHLEPSTAHWLLGNII